MRSSSMRPAFFATVLLIVTLGVTMAQAPPAQTLPGDLPPHAEATPEPSSTPNPIESKIRSALEGAPGGVNSSDPLLDDVLGIIKSRGSILDGSSLDPALDTPTSTAGNDREASAREASAREASARVAESLLRSARLLNRIKPRDSARTELVEKMRHEAWHLLGESAPAVKQ
ncbi:hypothetical protein [Novipirellula sp.]|uniref:hypothetical protein n=1 Tax=Novipirellula sp. TaxID=2795430 RepID=UPI003566743C